MLSDLKQENTTKKIRKIKTDFDTIVCPAHDWGIDEVFLKEKRWYAVRIKRKNIFKLKYFAPYETQKKSIRFLAKIKKIERIENTDKYQIIFKELPKKIKPIKRSKENPHLAPQNKLYTQFELFKNAKILEDLVY